MRSRWLDICRVLCVHFYKSWGPLKHINRTRLISCHLEQTSLVNKEFIILPKRFAFFWIKHDLVILGARKEGQLCLWHNKNRVVYVFFVLTVLHNFLQLHHQHCPKITNSVSFSWAGSRWAIWSKLSGVGKMDFYFCVPKQVITLWFPLVT